MRKSVLVLLLGALLALSGGIGLARQEDGSSLLSAQGGPRIAASGNQDLTGVVATLQESLRRVPLDHRSWALLGLAYVEQARVTGDASLYARAEEAVTRSLQIERRRNFTALTAGAALAAARHDFAAALSQARQGLTINPYDEYALAVRVDALTELGRYDEQLRALAVADRRRPGVPVAARYAYAFELRGQLGRAAAVLRRTSTTAGVADRAFLLTLMADIERRRGDLAGAAARLAGARRADPTYLPADVSRARLAAARGRIGSAVSHWTAVVSRLPVPEYLMELGELYLLQGRTDLADQQFAVVESTIRLLAAEGVQMDLETALYEAEHGSPRRALASARAEYGRRQSIHTADVLGWALHRSGRSDAALRYAREATRLGTAEAGLWLHRGTIEAALGMREIAIEHLRRGLATDAGYAPWQADRATALLRRLEASR